jgi:protocatechuate 3,4-dioxygenase beta subunit
MRRWYGGLAFVIFVLNVFLAQAATQETIDFEAIATGTVVSEVFTSNGSGPIYVHGVNPSLPDLNAAAIFDSANPTGADDDLGTPNMACGGPGNGTDSDVQPGGEFENCTPLGNVLIIQSENCLTDPKTDCPNDIGYSGVDAPIALDFSALGAVTLYEMKVVDIDGNLPGPTVDLLDASGNLLATFDIPNTMPDNGVAVISLGPTTDVAAMIVHLNGSGAIDDIVFKNPIDACTGRIGDMVWHDLNRDGLQDPGEPGIEGVSISLKNAKGRAIASVHTQSNGFYNFIGLCAGNFTVEVDETTLAPEFAPTPADQGGDDTMDSDGSPVDVILPDDDTDDPTVDFGYSSPCAGAIGDLVWHDADRDGIQDAGEPGLGGINVTLLDVDGSVIAVATTDANGGYRFTGLCAGDYAVAVDETTLAPEFVATPADLGGDDTVDSDGSPVDVTLPADDTDDPTVDFGYSSPCAGAIGDLVWHDANRDGIQDAGEPGLGGINLTLKDMDARVLAETTTDANGAYLFTGLCAGDYAVAVDETTLAPEFAATPVEQGGDDTMDSDGSPVDVTLPADDVQDPTVDFGYSSPCTGAIGDLVWHDVNRNGVQDAGEPGLGGIDLALKDMDGSVLAGTTTDNNGMYRFTGLCMGDYTVEVDETTLAPEFIATPADLGGDDAADSDGSPIDVTLPADDTDDPTVDFGYNSPCTGAIGDLVWHDADRDGIQDTGEPGLAGISVTIKDIDGNTIAATTTDANGVYRFTGLCAGEVVIEVNESMLPAGFQPTPIDSGGDDAADSDGSPVTVTLAADDTDDATNDFGYNSACAGSIGDFVWHDHNRDGIQGIDEPGIDNAKVLLKDGVTGSLVAETLTGSDGSYGFSGLCAGDYRVDVDETTLPPNFEATAPDREVDDTVDSDGPADGGFVFVSLTDDNTQNVTIDFGYVSPCAGSLGDFVWHDKNRNGLQDAAEPGLEGIHVILKDDQGRTIATDGTGPNGFYQFTGLCAGDYSVDVNETDLPPDFEPTLPLGGDAHNDSDGPSDGGAVMISLAVDNVDDPTIDFGFVSPCTGAIGDFIWFDENGNGIQEPGEAGMESIKVVLKDTRNVTIAETTTNADGAYGFNGLCAGEFKVAVDETKLPAGLEPSVCNAGDDHGMDNNCSPTGVSLPEDSSADQTVDFGYKSPDPDCGQCDGHITQLTLQYNGNKTAKIKVLQDLFTVAFHSTVEPGGKFIVKTKGQCHALGSALFIYTNYRFNTKIRTNCLQPIGPGLVSGDFEVVEGYSKNGGRLCPLDSNPNPCGLNESDSIKGFWESILSGGCPIH